MPGPERIWMLLAITWLPSMKSLLIHKLRRSGGEMAAQSPSVRKTERISPAWVWPTCGEMAEGRTQMVAAAAVCIRVSAEADIPAAANNAARAGTRR